jgi:cytidylate kinase
MDKNEVESAGEPALNAPARRITIAIDGPAGSGKSTVARRVADAMGFMYIDSGAMYRAVALWALRQRIDPADAHRMEQLALAAAIRLEPGKVFLNGEEVTADLRTPEVSRAASVAATHAGVRRALVAKQRAVAETASVVMEGRDIGTVVFPQAHVKIFLDASPEERLRRRQAELEHAPPDLARQLAERDQRDRTRAESPLVQAEDAIYLDTTALNLDEVVEAVLAVIRKRLSNGASFVRTPETRGV